MMLEDLIMYDGRETRHDHLAVKQLLCFPLFNTEGNISSVGADEMTLTVPAEALQAVSQQFAVSVEPPGFIHHLVQLLVLVLSCTQQEEEDAFSRSCTSQSPSDLCFHLQQAKSF